MEEGALIRKGKLRRKVAMPEKAKKPELKKASPRNPLTDVNALSVPSNQASIDAQRRGCFRFLRPSSSSKEDVIPRSKSRPRTPKSAPPSSKTLSSKTITDSSLFPKKPPQKPISESPLNPRLKRQANPMAPAHLYRWSQLRPSSKHFGGGKISGPKPIFEVDLKGRNGSLAICTPDRTVGIVGVNPSASETKEVEQLSGTPPSNSTPPIEASISPEVPCGLLLSPTPLCFATGHAKTGVKDRRKCRPRGILTIGEEQSNVSHVSSAPPPCAEASVCWFSSPPEIENESGIGGSSSKIRTSDFPNEASVNWLLSPIGAVEQVTRNDLMVLNSSILNAKFGEEATPSSCFGVLRTPTSGSSISPFSMIVQRAEASSGLRVPNSNREKGGYINDNPLEFSPFSPKSWSNCGAVSTLSSYTSSRRNGVIAPLELDSVTEDLEAIRYPSTSVLAKCQNDVSSLSSLGFKFGCQPTVLDSIDLNCFKISRCNEPTKVEMNKNKLSSSAEKISWREGLLSRIFDMGELDSYHRFFGDEYADYPKDCNESARESGSSTFEKGNGFGSCEFPVDNNKIGVQLCKSDVSCSQSNSMAESISTEGVLISSGDSDWTLFYKNNLFEV